MPYPRRSLLVVLATALSLGCETTSLAPVSDPVVETLGATTVRAGSAQVWAVLDYRFAAADLGSKWLILNVAVTAANGRKATIERASTFIRTPAGRRVRLLTRAEYREAWPELRSVLRRAETASSPLLAYFPDNRRRCDFEFFGPPGSTAYDSVEINDRRVCTEQLVFRISGGIQPGRWVLGIDLIEGEVRIPFDLG